MAAGRQRQQQEGAQISENGSQAGPKTHLDLVDVDFEENDGGELGGELLELGGDHAAGAAPGGGEVHNDLPA